MGPGEADPQGIRLVAGERGDLRAAGWPACWPGLAGAGVDSNYSDAGEYPLGWLPVSVLVYLLLHDKWFYWTHRWMHRPKPFKLAHAVHHASRPPPAWAAMSFHPVEALTGAVVIPALVLTIPIHYGALLAVLSTMTLMASPNYYEVGAVS